MPELFTAMLREEWWIHSTMFVRLSFAMFPFMSTCLLPLIQSTAHSGSLVVLPHANYLMLGFMVGACGLLGNEVINRRFGQASLVAYAVRSLSRSPEGRSSSRSW
jgi:hypothetical protein